MNQPTNVIPFGLEPGNAIVNEQLLQSLDAERAVIGAVLYSNRAFNRLDTIAPEHFSDPLHRRIYAECLALRDSGGKATPNTVLAAMLGDEELSRVGGIEFLKGLAAGGAASATLEGDASVMRRLSVRRQLVGASDHIRVLAYATQGRTEELIGEAEEAIRKIGTDGLTRSVDSRDAAEEMLKTLNVRGVSTGYAAFDRYLKQMMPQDLIILGGRPSMGKTSIAMNIAWAVAMRGYAVHVASLEMSAGQLSARALSRMSYGTDDAFQYQEFRSQPDDLDLTSIQHMSRRQPRNLVIDDMGGQSIAHLEAAARATRSKLKQLDLVVVDYLQLMSGPSGRGSSLHEDVTLISQGLKSLAKRLNCPIIALSQLSRKLEERNDKRPQLSDLRESGAIEQDADVVMFAFRESYYLSKQDPVRNDRESEADWRGRQMLHEQRLDDTENKLEVIFAKNRHGPCGTADMFCDLAYDVVGDAQP